MATTLKHEDSQPNDLNAVDEGYWAALLNEGEYARALDTAPVIVTTGQPAAETVDSADDWAEIEAMMQNDEILELKVIGYNRGGLLVEWRSLRGFVPASQLMSFTPEGRDEARRTALVERVGTWLRLRVIELDGVKNRLILSERAAMVQSGARAEILRRLQPGTRTHGTVTNLCDFGAFIDLGGVEGLIHISELSWGRVGHPADLLERGQDIEVYVLEVDPDQARVALSLKRLNPDPWATVQERYQVGEIVEGRITNVVDFGAFACIEEGLEGLIHFSELAEGHFLHPRNVVAEGDLVRARILAIDGRARRLGLSLRMK